MTLARLALRTYPAQYRRERGDELVATLAEAQRARAPRELIGLVAGGLRQRAADDRKSGFAGVFSAGAGFAALVLLLLQALAWGAGVTREVVVVRLGLARDPGVHYAGMLPWTTLAWEAALAVSALAAAALLCRGRPIAAALVTLAPLAPQTWSWMPPDLVAATSPASWRAGYAVWATVVVATAVLAAAARPHAVRHSSAWLAIPIVLAALSTWYWITTLAFWPLGVLVVSLFLLSPLRPALGVAAAAISLPVAAVVAPFAVLRPEYAYAMPVLVGALAVALAAAVFSPLREHEERGAPL